MLRYCECCLSQKTFYFNVEDLGKEDLVQPQNYFKVSLEDKKKKKSYINVERKRM